MKKLKVIFVYFLDYLSGKKGLARNTISSYRYNLKRYVNFLKENEIYSFDRVNKKIINDYSAYLEKKGLKIGSIRGNLQAIKAFYRFMLFEGYINKDISSLIEFPQGYRKFPHHDILSLKETNMLLDNSNFKGYLGQRDRAILELFYATGIRVSELINLKIEDVDMENQELKCLRKDPRKRIIPFGNKAYHYLSLYLEKVRPRLAKDLGENALFLGSKRGRRLSRQLIIYLMQRYGRRAGIEKKVNSCILRYTFAAHLLENGTDLRSIQMMLDHPKISYTRDYLNINNYRIKVEKKVKKEGQAFPQITKIRLFCKDCINFKKCEGKRWEECKYGDELLKIA